MNIVRDDGDERQRRVELMIDEFRQAQSRRLAKAGPVKGPSSRGIPRDAPVHQRPGQGHTTYFTFV